MAAYSIAERWPRLTRMAHWNARHLLYSGLAAFILLLCVPWVAIFAAQVETYWAIPSVPPSLAPAFGVPSGCLDFLNYPDYFGALGLATPPQEALDMGLLPSKKTVRRARRNAMRCWHPDKARRYAIEPEAKLAVAAVIQDAAAKLLKGGSVPRELGRYDLWTAVDFAAERSGGFKGLGLIDLVWYKTPLAPDYTSLPHFHGACRQQCTIPRGLDDLLDYLATPPGHHKPNKAAATLSIAELFHPTNNTCPHCTLAEALSPYTAYLAPQLRLAATRPFLHVDLFNQESFPPRLYHHFWLSQELKRLADTSWFWWFVRRWGLEGHVEPGWAQSKAIMGRRYSASARERIDSIENGWSRPFLWEDVKWQGRDEQAVVEDRAFWDRWLSEFKEDAKHEEKEEMRWSMERNKLA